jgi:hypothetical protein
MEGTVHFGEVLEAADQLSVDEQMTLIEVLRHRLAERRREFLSREIQQARQEFAEGRCSPVTPQDILKSILS